MEQMEPLQENPQETQEMVAIPATVSLEYSELNTVLIPEEQRYQEDVEFSRREGISIEGVVDYIRPPFSFLGQDGKFYRIGHSPRNFEIEIFTVLDRLGTVGADNPNLPEWMDLWDDWIYEHIRVVPDQAHIKREDIPFLYFLVDRPEIVGMILERFSEAMNASTQTMQIMADAGDRFAEVIRAKKEAMKNGNREQVGEQAVLSQAVN